MSQLCVNVLGYVGAILTTINSIPQIFKIIKTKDGLYSMLYIKNVTTILIKELILQSERYFDQNDKLFDK